MISELINAIVDNSELIEKEYNCSKCNDMKMIEATEEELQKGGKFILDMVMVEGEWREIKYVECVCSLKEKARHQAYANDRGHQFDKYQFSKYDPYDDNLKKIYNSAKEFASKNWRSNEYEGSLFYFGGETGSGKSHLCHAIAFNMMYNRYRVVIKSWESIVSKAKADSYSLDSQLKELANAEVLYIDDFLKIRDNDMQKLKNDNHVLDWARMVLDTRYRSGKVTIISSEFNVDNLRDFDKSLGGRIIEMSNNGQYMHFLGEGYDYRFNKLKGV